jgi:hypothetical protein
MAFSAFEAPSAGGLFGSKLLQAPLIMAKLAL